jgi:hypothetical protein
MSQNQLDPKPLELQPNGHYVTPEATRFQTFLGTPGPDGKMKPRFLIHLPGEVLLEIPLSPQAFADAMQTAGPLVGLR